MSPGFSRAFERLKKAEARIDTLSEWLDEIMTVYDVMSADTNIALFKGDVVWLFDCFDLADLLYRALTCQAALAWQVVPWHGRGKHNSPWCSSCSWRGLWNNCRDWASAQCSPGGQMWHCVTQVQLVLGHLVGNVILVSKGGDSAEHLAGWYGIRWVLGNMGVH